MHIVLTGATAELRQALRPFIEKLEPHLAATSLSVAELALLRGLPDAVKIMSDGSVSCTPEQELLLRQLEYGTTKLPKLGILGRIRRALEQRGEAEMSEAVLGTRIDRFIIE